MLENGSLRITYRNTDTVITTMKHLLEPQKYKWTIKKWKSESTNKRINNIHVKNKAKYFASQWW